MVVKVSATRTETRGLSMAKMEWASLRACKDGAVWSNMDAVSHEQETYSCHVSLTTAI